MVILLLTALFATLNAIVSGYYLVQGVQSAADAPGRTGSFIFSGIAGATALFLFIVALVNYELNQNLIRSVY